LGQEEEEEEGGQGHRPEEDGEDDAEDELATLENDAGHHAADEKAGEEATKICKVVGGRGLLSKDDEVDDGEDEGDHDVEFENGAYPFERGPVDDEIGESKPGESKETGVAACLQQLPIRVDSQ
jgi:hypothetical protein